MLYPYSRVLWDESYRTHRNSRYGYESLDRTSRSSGYGYESLAELPEVPGIVAGMRKMYPYPGYLSH